MQSLSLALRLTTSLTSVRALSAYAVEGFEPALVFDFDDEYYRTGGSTSTFDAAMTHTRSGNATMVDSDGLLKWAPHNLLTYSEDLSEWGAPQGSSSVSATTFVEDSTNTLHRIFSNPPSDVSGTRTLEATVSCSSDRRLLINADAAMRARALFDLSGAGSVVSTGGVNYVSSSIVNNNDGTYTVTLTGSFSGSAGVGFQLCESSHSNTSDDTYLGNGSSRMTIERVHLYRSDLGGMVDNPDRGDSYVPTTSAARYLPRRGHHIYNGSEWVNEGVLHESEARTNLLTYSEDFTNAAWTKGGVTVSTNSEVAPDGTFTADKIVETTATSVHRSFATVANSASGVAFTFSLYIKAAERAAVRVALGGLGMGTDRGADFNLFDGTKHAEFGSPDAAIIANAGNGFYKIVVTATTTATTAFNPIVYVSDSPGNTSYTGDGTSGIYIWGAQLEAASTPSSYIPTSGSTATRSADAITVPAANLPWPTPNVIGPELVTNGTFDDGLTSWTSASFDAATLESGGARIERDGVSVNSALIQADVCEVGKLYLLTYDILNGNGNIGNAVLIEGAIGTLNVSSVVGSYSHVFVATGTSFIARCYLSNFATIDNISVREIDPLSVSIQMDGRMTYADEDDTLQVYSVRWVKDSGNFIQLAVETDGVKTGGVRFSQRALSAGGINVLSSGTTYSPGTNVPFNIASRHGSTFINGAVDGVALTADTTPTALPDLSSTDLNLGFDYMGTIRQLRIWSDDLGDAGIAEASEGEPSSYLLWDATADTYVQRIYS